MHEYADAIQATSGLAQEGLPHVLAVYARAADAAWQMLEALPTVSEKPQRSIQPFDLRLQAGKI
ncbi:hypothetical protein SAMN06298226_0819 [Nitrosovibrio sp. Nv4]|nr:hypothetical protein SAMN06298226_0819 [Nitrosovibrio sp. Nv4]